MTEKADAHAAGYWHLHMPYAACACAVTCKMGFCSVGCFVFSYWVCGFYHSYNFGFSSCSVFNSWRVTAAAGTCGY